jgi:dihydroorotase (multifunctional complex type)
MIRLPGLIDTHVHLREPGATQKEDFETGTKAAVAGGYTVILDMPNNPEPTISPKALNKKIFLCHPRSNRGSINKINMDSRFRGNDNRIYCDVGFHFGAAAESIQYFQKISKKVFALKVYMNHTTGTLLIEDPRLLEKVFSNWPKQKVLMTHAEDETLEKAINLSKKFGNRLHVCHLSLRSQIEMVKNAKLEGLPITCEVSAHHLFLTEKDVKTLGPFGMMRPPLASKTDQEALWKNIDFIDTIASDHAPHTLEEKQKSPTPNGIPGLETTLPLLLTAVSQKKLTLGKLIDMTNIKPRLIFGIPQQPETYIEVDEKKSYIISDKNLFTKCKWTPFQGLRGKGKVMKVVLRGKTIFQVGKFKTDRSQASLISDPTGQVIYP